MNLGVVEVFHLVVGCLEVVACLLGCEAADHSYGCGEHLANVLLIEVCLAGRLHDGCEAVAEGDGLAEAVVVVDEELSVGCVGCGLDGSVGIGGVDSYGVAAGGEGKALAVGSHAEALRGGGEETVSAEVEEALGADVIEVVARVALVVDDYPVGEGVGNVLLLGEGGEGSAGCG